MNNYEAKCAAVRSVVEGAIRELIALGMEPEGAAALLAVQGINRMPDPQARRALLPIVFDVQPDELPPEIARWSPDDDDLPPDALH